MGIFITHRVENTADLNPRILVFADGKIVGDGTHKEMLNNCKEYAKLLGKDDELLILNLNYSRQLKNINFIT